MDLNFLSKVILDSAFRVHSAVGPGLYEHVYEVILAHELKKQNLMAERQVPLRTFARCVYRKHCCRFESE
ncbi:MAG: GxxExxY protein [Verrucomicrobia bacterium]|nr:GxxExxY protein [Verrucomicrobiota bacterium]